MKSVAESQPPSSSRNVIRTTLYDLVDAVNQAVGPEHEELVVAIVAHVLEKYQGKFVHQPLTLGQWN